MAEVEVSVESLFRFVKNPKIDICHVWGCTNRRKKTGHRICPRHDMKLWRARNPMKAAFARLRAGAIRRNLPFTLTLKQFSEISEATGYIERKGNHSYSLSIDRINAHLGYSIDNIRIITLAENVTKGNRERKSVFLHGVRIPWEEVDPAVLIESNTEHRKSFVPYFQQSAAPEADNDNEEEEPPAWLIKS